MRPFLFLLLFVASLALAQSGPARFALPPLVEAEPGDYATLFFRIQGSGQGRLELAVPPGWTPLPHPEAIELVPPETPVVVTVRVPETARAGQAFPVVLRFCPAGGACVEARGRVTVLHRPGLSVHVEPESEGILGEPTAIRVTVTNRGNRPDRVVLVARPNTGLATVEPSVLELEPGATGYATLRLALEPDRAVSPGYRMATWIEARSRYPGVTARARTLTRWLPAGGLGALQEDPTLALDLRANLGVGGALTAGRLGGWRFDYGLAPRLRGDLSDFVRAELGTDPLEKGRGTIWPEPPSRLQARLSAERWSSALSLDPRRASLQVSLTPGDWRWSVGGAGRYDLRELNFSAGVASARRDLNLQAAGRVTFKEGDREDQFSLRHVRPLGGGWALRLGAQYNGRQDPGGYTAIVQASPQLVWRGPRHDLVAGLALAPQIGLYAAHLTGGMRRFYPFGLRGTASYQVDPEGTRYRLYASAVAIPAGGSSLKLDAGLRREAGEPLALELIPAASYVTSLVPGVRLSLGGGYRLRYRPASGETEQSLRVSLGLRGSAYSAAGHLRYRLGDPYPTAGLRFDLQPTASDRLELGYLREADRIEYRAGWTRSWGSGVQSYLGLERTEDPVPKDRIRAGVLLDRIAGEPYGLSLGYTLADPDGLGEGSAPLEHRFRVGLVLGLRRSFATPEPVVRLFGGRREGQVSGLVFLDENQNGRPDPGEAGVAGVRVRIGRAAAVSDASGRYALRVRPGTYRPRLADLPATLGLYREAVVEVRQGARIRLDLPVAATAQVPVWIFYDENQNGRPDPGERGIPYAGVRVEGPGGVRTVQADAEGRVLVDGLLPGTTAFSPDPGALPPRFRPTAEPRVLVLEAGRYDEPVALGAAPPPKKVTTTFRPGKLAVFALLPRPTAVPGGELEVRAMLTGEASAVWVELPGGKRAELEATGPNRYRGWIRLPRPLKPGPLELRVVAERGEERAESLALATVVPGPLYRLEPRRVQAGRFAVRIELAFRAGKLYLELPNGETLELESTDGRRWRGALAAPAPGPLRVRPVADGEALEPTTIEVLGREEER